MANGAPARLRLFLYAQDDCALDPGVACRPAPVLAQPNPELFDVVASPDAADFVVFPYLLSDVGASRPTEPDYVYQFLPRLRWFAPFEARHVFFLPGVDTWAPLFRRSVFFRTSVHRRFPDLNAVATPHYESALNFPYDNASYQDLVYHCSFVGFPGSWPPRMRLVEALSRARGLNCYWKITKGFHGHLSPEQQREDTQAYQESLKRSVTVLCPRGAGLNSIRFFETLAMGRIPVLISDDCTLPLEDEIQYDRFIIRVREADVGQIGTVLQDWFNRTPPEEIAAKFVVARAAWEQHLSPARQEAFVVHHLRKVQAAGYQLHARQAAAVAALQERTRICR